MEEYKIIKAEKKDIERIWEIRNYSSVRGKSGNSKIIGLKDHRKWFYGKYSENKNNFCFVLVERNKVIGYCRFDYDEEDSGYVLSIAIDPENQSRGLGSRLLEKSLGALQKIKRGSVLAEVKKDNDASNKLFERNGFKKRKEDENNYYYIKEL